MTADRNNNPSGLIFDISRGCFHDGPGLRTVVFLKGCPAGCPWCQNLEGISPAPEIAYDARRCIDCLRCRSACPRSWPSSHLQHVSSMGWREGCTGCGKCAAVCPSRARRLVGRRLTVAELLVEIERDTRFFDGTGGGVTFSGGEPLVQSEFLFAAAEALRHRGVHVALETSGYFAPTLLPDVARLFGPILYDLKHVELARCRKALRNASSRALENLGALLAESAPLRVRLTLVPGFNESDEDLRAIGAWLREHGAPPVTLQGFHRLAVAKQELFGRPYPCADLQPVWRVRLSEAAELLRQLGLEVELG